MYSKKFQFVKDNYDEGFYDKRKVHDLVGKRITPEEYEEITGEPYES